VNLNYMQNQSSMVKNLERNSDNFRLAVDYIADYENCCEQSITLINRNG